ncbi:hypothetical protein JTE90_010133 [Oedothorax gibbosus]|uniref:DUF5641 domain-containing protein n=1 Tax=Oedothorax gibbosus TaxID=931172 RepID=A0AAV6UJ01_9ARAC|nr:hypothetical protein JTE90_010133 [Oedothorax gibbosus]
MFLQDMQTVGVPDLDHLDEVDVTRRFRYQQKLREELRKRFRSEYLGQLTLAKSNMKCKELKLNDIVLVEDDSKKRAFWPLGRITAKFPEIEASSDAIEEVQETVKQLIDKNKTRNFPVPKEVPERTTRCGRSVQLPSKLQDFELS